MNKLIQCFSISLSLLFAQVTFAQNEMTEEIANQVLAEIDAAANNLDAQALASLLTDAVAITLNITIQDSTQVVTPSKQDYILMLEQGWGVTTDYKYSRSNTTIDIVDNTAVVTSNVVESMTIQGSSMTGSSKEEAVIELIDGEPLVTKVIAYISM